MGNLEAKFVCGNLKAMFGLVRFGRFSGTLSNRVFGPISLKHLHRT